MNCILEEWRKRGGSVDGREVFCLLGIDTVCFDIQFVSFQRNNLFPISGRAHVCLRVAGSVFLQNVATILTNKRRLLLEESNLETYRYKNISFT